LEYSSFEKHILQFELGALFRERDAFSFGGIQPSVSEGGTAANMSLLYKLDTAGFQVSSSLSSLFTE
jgi:hypothetical protein